MKTKEGRAVPSPSEITVSQLARLIGLPLGPALVDVRIDEDFATDPRLIPGSMRRVQQDPEFWATAYMGKSVVVVCNSGGKLSQGVAAWLRHEEIAAETLEGGFAAWAASRQPLLNTGKLPQSDAQGRLRLLSLSSCASWGCELTAPITPLTASQRLPRPHRAIAERAYPALIATLPHDRWSVIPLDSPEQDWTVDIERREMLKGAGLIAGGAMAASILGSPAFAQTAPLRITVRRR